MLKLNLYKKLFWVVEPQVAQNPRYTLYLFNYSNHRSDISCPKSRNSDFGFNFKEKLKATKETFSFLDKIADPQNRSKIGIWHNRWIGLDFDTYLV